MGILYFYLLNLATLLPGSRHSETTNHTMPQVGARGVVSTQTMEAAVCVSMRVTCVHVCAPMPTGMVLCVCNFKTVQGVGLYPTLSKAYRSEKASLEV